MLLGFMSKSLFSSRSFIILGFAFRSLIHFEFFFFFLSVYVLNNILILFFYL